MARRGTADLLDFTTLHLFGTFVFLVREAPLRKLQPPWGTYAVKIEVQMAFAQVGREIKCPRVPV